MFCGSRSSVFPNTGGTSIFDFRPVVSETISEKNVLFFYQILSSKCRGSAICMTSNLKVSGFSLIVTTCHVSAVVDSFARIFSKLKHQPAKGTVLFKMCTVLKLYGSYGPGILLEKLPLVLENSLKLIFSLRTP